jgi:RHS repeat-associated protein
MRLSGRWLTGGLAVCLAGVLALVALAGTALSSPQGRGGATAGQKPASVPLSLEPPFSAYTPATAAQLSADAASRYRFRGFKRAAAASLAKQDFHIDHPSWTPPTAENGAQLGRYLGEDAVVEKLRNGRHDLVSSTIPLRVNNGSGLAPTSLTLHEADGAYAPANPVVPVTISKQAAGGIGFPAGVSVTPVSVSSPEASTVVGSSVLYANTAKDTDLIAAPRPGGAEVSWQLRSQESPQSQGLTFHLPAGAKLRSSASVPGGVEAVVAGEEILLVPPAIAHDAQGNVVPASYSLSGDVLTTHVALSGNVAFPVLVDPTLIFYGYYGARNGANVWSGWQASAPQGHFGAEANAGWYKIGTNPGAPVGSYGALTITAPGPAGKSGSAGITRVDLTGVQHGTAGQSQLISTINESNGPAPDFSFNATGGATGPLPWYDGNNFSGQAVSFCASGAGGHDGGEQPLCDEEHYQGHVFVLEDEITSSPQSAYNWVLMEGAQVTYRDPASPNKVVLSHPGYEGQWLTTGPTNWKIEAEDEGLGISRFELQIPAGNAPRFTDTVDSSPGVPCATQNGFTGCPSSETSEPINLSGLGTGAYSLAPVAVDAAENTGRPEASYVGLYIDKAAPEIGSLSGPLAQAAGGVIGDGNYALSFDPTDGSSSSPQSGVETVEIKVDGVHAYTDTTACPTPKGVPAANCFGLNGTWIMNGQAYGAGPHTITVIAKDWLGHESSSSFGVTVNEAAYESLGPGAVNLETGDYKLNPTDVSLSGGNATLSVSRTYDSRGPTRGASGPLGPQWMLNLPGSAAEEEWQSLVPLPDGSVTLTNAHGTQVTFSPKTGGGYNPPAGYQTETLTAPKSGTYQLTDTSGDYTQFTQSVSGAPYTPSSVVQSGSAGELNKVKYTFTTKEGITEPTQVLGPEPTEGACTAKLVQGCRALTFEYATSTGASGEAPSEWGTYKGRLAKVFFTAWEPVKGEMAAPVAVAQYSYDKQGRLRAEWDPRISPNLKTTYGYDGEGHISALASPHQQPWLLTNGTGPGDANTGRLVKITRPQASTPLWTGLAPANTEAPQLSGSPSVGTRMGVSIGKWSSEPAAYGFQWEDCNTTGSECTPIPGATGENYTVAISDGGHKIAALVTATNADGSTTVATASSSLAGAPAAEYPIPTTGIPEEITLGPDGNLWYTLESGVVGKITPSGAITEYPLGSEKAAFGITTGLDGHLWVGEYNWKTNSGAILKMTSSGEVIGEYPIAGAAESIAQGPNGNIWFGNGRTHKIGQITTSGAIAGEYTPAEGWGFKVASGPDGNVWYTNTNASKIGKVTPKGAVTEYALPALSGPNGITTGPDGNLWYANYESNRVGKISSLGEKTEYTLSGTAPWGIVTGPDGNLWSTISASSTIAKITTTGTITIYRLPENSNPRSIAAGPEGDLWYLDRVSKKIGKMPTWGTAATSEGTQYSPQPGWTLDYHVPVSGGGAPYALGSNEVAAWGQKDDAVDATAIFPPDEAQTWPASDYKRATVYYMDSANRTVNVASPSGAISTTEYNNLNNNVERGLSADNREAALKEGSKSAEVAEALSTKSSYSSDGTELQSTLGPEHTIQLANGAQVKARKHVRFFYDEGAPAEGGPYRLVTKSIEGAQVTGGENEQEPRTITNSYSGQENLGWKLRAPTSTTTTVHGKELVSKTQYEASTGNVIETQTPGAAAPSGISYSAVFGSLGTGNGQLSAPKGIAVDAKGDVLVADELNNRIEIFTEKGEYKSIGSVGSGSGQLKDPRGVAVDSRGDIWVVDTGNNRTDLFNEKGEFEAMNGWGVNDGKAEFERCTGASCRVGIAGSGGGQFKEPTGVAIDSRGDAVVTDTGNNRTELFNENGEFEGANGWGVSNGEAKFETCSGSGCQAGIVGSGAGQFKEPTGVAIGAHNSELILDTGNSRVEIYNENGGYERTFGSVGSGNGQFKAPKGIAVDSHSNVWVADTGNYRVQELSEKGEYVAQVGSKGAGPGQFQEPYGLQLNSHGEVFVGDVSQDRIQRFTQGPDQGNSEGHDTQTIYYTTAASGTYPSCGKHPEWAGLACEAQHAAQPGVDGLPSLPITTYTYNIWNEPLSTTDTVGTTTRTSTDTYDGAGRLKTAAISASVDTPLPTVTYEYNSETGALSKQSTTVEGKTKSITSVENTLGQMTSYTDADGNIATYEYEPEKDDRVTKANDGKGTQTYSYNATTGEVSSLKDSAAGTFTATRDVEGNITTEGYPNGMNANRTLNAVGEPINLEYVKTTHCSSGCTLYSDAVTPSIFSQWRTQTSTLSKQSYEYDEMGRLTQVQDTPAGKGCTTRLYAYDEDGNRTSLTSREPNSKGECAAEGGTVESHSYDTADRLIDEGVSYDAFGNTTTLPAADVGGSALASTFYVNDTLASQEQNGEKISYNLDPSGRTREAVSTGTTSSTVISHYMAAGDSPAWTANGTGWTRYISGIGSGLAAIQTNSETPVLQLENLHGDIIATAALSETETKLLSTSDTTEYGVPRTGSPAKYSWLGSAQRPTELPTGIIDMGARAYIPQLGRFEQTDPQPGGSVNAYAYTFDDPVNSSDLSGEFTNTVSYNEGAAETGAAQAGLPEFYAGPGAIAPPHVNMQIEDEFVAHLPWNVPAVQTASTGGRLANALRHGGLGAIITDHAQGCWMGALKKEECEHRPPSKGPDTHNKKKKSHGGSAKEVREEQSSLAEACYEDPNAVLCGGSGTPDTPNPE